MRYCNIAFISKSRYPLSDTELDDIIVSARTSNQKLGVTGVLLYHHNTFFEFFEGNVDSVNAVYARIKSSRKHHHIIEVARGTSKTPYFEQWSMGFSYPPNSEIQKSTHAIWCNNILRTRKHSRYCKGLQMLLEFWGKLAQDHVA